MSRVRRWRLFFLAAAVFLGLVEETGAQDGAGGSLVLSASSSQTALLTGRAAYPSTPFWWSGATLRFSDSEGNEVARAALDMKGYFSANIPQNMELHSVLLNEEGCPVSKTGFVLAGGPDLSFEPIPDASPLLLYEPPDGASLTFQLMGSLSPDVRPESLAFFLYPAPAEPPSWRASVEEYYRNKPALRIRPILHGENPLDLDMQRTIASLCETLAGPLALDPARRLLIAEGDLTSSAFSLACNYRDRFGGVVVWEGEPGEPIIANFKGTPVAILGSHTGLRKLTEWSQSCRSLGCPVLVKSYWSEPSAFELEGDVFGALDWVSTAQNRGRVRKIDHSTYLPEFGRYQWIWITELACPGNLARVEGEWTEGGAIRLKATGVSRLRIHLEGGFGRYGQRVLIQLDSLTLPITLGWRSNAVELLRKSKEGIWIPRFTDFEDPVAPIKIAEIPSPGFEKGSEISSFSRFARVQLHSDCAWGYTWEDSIDRGTLTDRVLYERVSPFPYVHVFWTPIEIERFHQWREEQENLSMEISGYRPVWTGSEPPPSEKPLKCAVPLPILKKYLQATNRPVGEEFSPIDVNQQELVGQYLGKQYR